MIKSIEGNARYSKIRVVNGIGFTCGQFSSDLALDIKGQSLNTFAQIEALLAEAGTTKSNILAIQIHIADIANDFAEFNEVYDAWVSDVTNPPARTCVQAPMFAPECLVELTLTVAA